MTTCKNPFDIASFKEVITFRSEVEFGVRIETAKSPVLSNETGTRRAFRENEIFHERKRRQRARNRGGVSLDQSGDIEASHLFIFNLRSNFRRAKRKGNRLSTSWRNWTIASMREKVSRIRQR